jgi:hypothetical protein
LLRRRMTDVLAKPGWLIQPSKPSNSVTSSDSFGLLGFGLS